MDFLWKPELPRVILTVSRSHLNCIWTGQARLCLHFTKKESGREVHMRSDLLCCGSASLWCGFRCGSRSDLSLWCGSGCESGFLIFIWCGSGVLFDALFHPDADPDPDFNLILILIFIWRGCWSGFPKWCRSGSTQCVPYMCSVHKT